MTWWVIYDITSPRRLKRVAKLCKDAGLRQIQKSVYAGRVSQEKIMTLREALLQWVEPSEDRVLMLPVSKRSIKAAVSLGIDEKLEEMLNPKDFLII